jgi:hypothetical protein
MHEEIGSASQSRHARAGLGISRVDHNFILSFDAISQGCHTVARLLGKDVEALQGDGGHGQQFMNSDSHFLQIGVDALHDPEIDRRALRPVDLHAGQAGEIARIGQGQQIRDMVQVQMGEYYRIQRLQTRSHLIQAQEGARPAVEEERLIILY